MTLTLHGVGVSRGIAIGHVHVIERDQLEIPEYRVDDDAVEREVERFQRAVALARQQLRAVRAHIPPATSQDIAAFIDTHLLMLDDAALISEPARLIGELRCNAEWALKLQRDALVAVFDEMNDSYLRTRRDDVDHVVHRIWRALLKQTPLHHEAPDGRLRDYVVLADDLTPADTVLMQHQGVVAFVTEYGGPTSHTAILARSLGMPAIVGLQHARRYVRQEDLVVIDGGRGVLVVDPDPGTLEHYRERSAAETRHVATLDRLREAPAQTLDGHLVALHANIELPGDAAAALRVGATGVGLYRTEYMFMNRSQTPDEEEQYEAYVGVLRALEGAPVTIRTIDLGADKQVDGGRRDGPVAANPALGLRAVRLCLHEPTLFRPQLRAILRASACGPVRMMIPMLSSLSEVHQVIDLVAATRAELDGRGQAYDPAMPIGGMIEVPAAALCADAFARHLDFLSIGTNDLIQYTIAIDRVNEEVSYLYDPLNPGVLRLVRMVIAAGELAAVPVAMCGEMAGDPLYVRLLLALGLREFSVHPTALLEVKRIIRSSRLDALGERRDALLACATGGEVAQILAAAGRAA
ncbi:MAG: phosphoenolpyruvate--protein phosphotransferase [Gammaproteobacteria bacterium]|nr:phosphoenolpyruvate--protein phosphotransferase [Gammaproteobacteria bacterium]